VAGQPGAVLLMVVSQAFGKKPLVGQRRVNDRPGMALGKHQPVALRPVGILRLYLHDAVVQGDHDLHQAHHPADVPDTGTADGVRDHVAEFGGKAVQLLAAICSWFKLILLAFLRLMNYSREIKKLV